MASSQLTKTFSGNGSATTHTISMWVKRSKLDSIQRLFFTGSGSNQYQLYFLHLSGTYDNLLQFEFYDGSTNYYIRTNRSFRDTSAWYHIVAVWDTTNSTAGDRMRLYVNGVEETSFAVEQQPTQNFNGYCNQSTYAHRIGASDTGHYFDGLMTHVHSIDGTAYTPSAFGETDSTSGIWKPKTAPSVTHGTNGFFLKFENSGAMGTDSSGNSNTFTTSGTLTQNVDTPSNVFATLNTLTGATHTGLTLANGNLTIDGNTGTAWRSLMATLGVSSGKWYYEVKVKNLNDNVRIGLIDVDQMLQANGYFMINSRGYSYNNDGQKSNNDSSASYGNSYTTNDIIGIAMDLDNGKLYFSKNGTYQNSGVPTSGSTGTGSAYDISSGYTYAPCIATYTATDKLECNFGSGFFGTTAVASANADGNGFGAFEYAVPSGYYALCTKNIKEFG